MRLNALGELITQQQCLFHTAANADDHALEIDVEAAGFGDVKALDIDYITGAIAIGDDEAVILTNIDRFASTGGDIAALEVLATEGGADVHALFVGVGVGVVEQTAGVFADMDSALNNAVDVLTEFTTIGSDVQLFVANSDTVTIGNAAKFEEIEYILSIFSSKNIQPTFEYSTGVGTWGTFVPIDGTNGLLNNGVIAWLDSDIPTWAVGTGTEYLIRMTRTRGGSITSPTESLVQIAETTEFSWNKDGDVSVNAITASGAIIANNTITMAQGAPINHNLGSWSQYYDSLAASKGIMLGTASGLEIQTSSVPLIVAATEVDLTNGGTTKTANLEAVDITASGNISLTGASATGIALNIADNEYKYISAGNGASNRANLLLRHSSGQDYGQLRVGGTAVMRWDTGGVDVTGDITASGDLNFSTNVTGITGATGSGYRYFAGGTTVANGANILLFGNTTDGGRLRADTSTKFEWNANGIMVTEGTAPASASAAGTKGQVIHTADYIYRCTATDTWKRTALTTW